jgi:hypothetical protein
MISIFSAIMEAAYCIVEWLGITYFVDFVQCPVLKNNKSE